ncbi:hypothetical protein BC936DRAFT_140411 [Jimgerdemannia flammicorona]|uniref:Uncharacterized protein n=1 Tax=Jimgerdemannia flammicorona TaxID=994334 RepID=A0A433ATZ3_9FUNG|nr:hypothetical protein BC936DRAFT_140411 [Jimgerdemannia flammicorona]
MGTGAVGIALVRQLLEREVYGRAVTVGCREVEFDGTVPTDRLTQKVINFENLEQHRDAFRGVGWVHLPLYYHNDPQCRLLLPRHDPRGRRKRCSVLPHRSRLRRPVGEDHCTRKPGEGRRPAVACTLISVWVFWRPTTTARPRVSSRGSPSTLSAVLVSPLFPTPSPPSAEP